MLKVYYIQKTERQITKTEVRQRNVKLCAYVGIPLIIVQNALSLVYKDRQIGRQREAVLVSVALVFF